MKTCYNPTVEKSDLRVMVIGAHPDDADNLAGGTAVKFARAGARVRFVSVCNGDKVREFVPDGPMPTNVEAFEMSEYGRTLSHGEIVRFFSFATI